MECILENIEAIFRKMKDRGWNIDSPHKWGFCFFSRSADPLKLIFKELEDHNYKLESLTKSNGDWRIEVSKAEILTPLKLHKRNIAFNELADHFDCDYDGWDVEPV
ncbi:ribonuclease E inhibitor RraB [Dyadobacter sandarakinus]|uniref:Ribonuclease E inhibitor RraB n=1 Tax=Dyadobacter sandarakinus TaxID=2747268 RepID=A0ABX7I3R9_9BACT|nr:ribonuclease E inhibitor RraB [Dyadobacter sandarakinus]